MDFDWENILAVIRTMCQNQHQVLVIPVVVTLRHLILKITFCNKSNNDFMWGCSPNNTPHSDFFSEDLNVPSQQQDATHVLLHAADYSLFQRTDRVTWHLSHLNASIYAQQVTFFIF
jgi:hypothetical protein